MKANIGIKQESISKVVDVLAKVLADEFVLYTKTKKGDNETSFKLPWDT